MIARSACSEPDAGLCSPNCDRAMKTVNAGADLMRLAMSKPLQGKEDLGSIRSIVEGMPRGLRVLACDESALAGKDLSDAKAFEVRASRWTEDETKVLALEQKARDEVIVPLCQATWELENARAEIAREKANPSGVVDLHELHVAGEAVQNAQDDIQIGRAHV